MQAGRSQTWFSQPRGHIVTAWTHPCTGLRGEEGWADLWSLAAPFCFCVHSRAVYSEAGRIKLFSRCSADTPCLWRTGYSPLCLLLKLEDNGRTLNRAPTGQPQFPLDQGSLSSSGSPGQPEAREAPEQPLRATLPASWTEALLALPSPAPRSLALSPQGGNTETEDSQQVGR